MTRKEPRPLEPGMNIKFVGPAIFDSGNTIYCNAFRAKVERDVDPSDMIVIRIYDYRGELENRTAQIHRRQVVSILRPRAKPPQEERGREWWVLRNMKTGGPGAFFSSKEEMDATSLRMMKGYEAMHLIELRPGEIPLSREDLAKAWIAVAGNSVVNHEFHNFCVALGFGGDE